MMRIEIPRLRLWHLLGFVAAGAAFLSVMQFRWSVEDPGYRGLRQLRALDATERAKAAGQLGGLRPPERRAIAPLAEALFDGDARVRAAAARSLSMIVHGDKDPEIGFVKAALASALGDRDPGARRAIAVALSGYRPEPGVVVPTLLEFAKDGDAEARAESIMCLGFYARKSEPARLAVFDAMGDPDLLTRLRAVNALDSCAAFPDLAPEPLLGMIVAALVKAADDESPIIRASAVRTLGGIANRTMVEIPRVIEALGDPDVDVRLHAAISLAWRISSGKRSSSLVPALVLALKDRDARVRLASAVTLGRLGTVAEGALPALHASANDPEKSVREKIEQAITRIGNAGHNARKALEMGLADLGNADPNVRASAASGLGSAGPGSAEAIPALVRCLSDREADVRRAAAGALGQLGPEAAVALPSLATLAESDLDERVRQAATLSRAILLRRPDGEDLAP
jgi:HEAT repeat protein